MKSDLKPVCWVDDESHALYFTHVCLSGGIQLVIMSTRLPLAADTGWTIVQYEPLTVAPSIHCKRCDTHGFYTEGKWVPA